VDIGIMGGEGILYKKRFRCFRVMGKVMDQGFNESAVFNFNFFILGNRNIEFLKLM